LEQWQKALLMPKHSVLVIDEIQKVAQWQEALKNVWDNHNTKALRVVVLGSSSFEIQQGMKESLAGRYEVLRVHHWNAGESRQVGISFKQYVLQGGYPGSYRYRNDIGRWQAYMRDSIIENILNKDIFRLRPLAKPVLFRQFLEIIRAYPCQEISYTKLLGQLQDRGNVELVKHYLFLLECAYLYRGLEKYSRKEYLKKASSPKILPLCPSLCTYSGSSLHWKDPDHYGRLFETAVGMVLNQLPGKLYYWREGKDEVDFVYEEDYLFAIEVKSGKQGSERGLSAFQKNFPDATLLVINPENFDSFDADPQAFLALMRG